jgi:hypothetical protein
MRPFLLSMLVAPCLLAQQQQARPATSISIPFEKYTLNNGLTVVLSEDHTTPTVAVEVIYHVGSKNEVLGHTGFAHMFEHVMFTGSGHVPYGTHDKFTEGSADRTTARHTSTGRATGRPIHRTISRPRSGSRLTAWAFCSIRSTTRSFARSATS